MEFSCCYGQPTMLNKIPEKIIIDDNEQLPKYLTVTNITVITLKVYNFIPLG